MPTTTGFVQRITLLQASRIACVWVGPSPNLAEVLVLSMTSSDSEHHLQRKHATIDVLSSAQIAGRQVDVLHPDNSAEIEQVSTTVCNNSAPIQVDAIEVTQGIQDIAQSIPLLAGKRTVVRVYLSHPNSPGITVQGEISIRQGPSDVPFVIPSENVVVLNPAEAGNLPIKREDATRSLNFVLPATTEGQMGIEISSITNTVTGTAVAFTCERRPAVWFHASAPLRLRVVGFRYTQNGVSYVPTPLDFALLQSWLGRAFPAGLLVITTTIVDAIATPPFNCGDINAQLAAIRTLDMDLGGDERTHYYGIVSDGGFFMRGCAGVPSEPSPDAVGSGPTGSGTWGWDTDGSYGDWYGGHELGHTYGRRHPGFCGETMNDLDNYPFVNGQLANANDSFIGFDVGDPANGLPMQALPGMQWRDVMTYCNFQWLSAYTYLGIRRRLAAEDALGSDGIPGLAPVSGGGRGRPDQRFPHERQRFEARSEITVSVVATVNLTQRTGKIQYVNPLEKPKFREQVGEDARLCVNGPDGQLLAEIPIAVRLDSELSLGDDREGIVDAIITVDPTSRAIELVVADRVVDTYKVGGPLPDVRALRAEVGTESIAIAADADETEGTYSVQVSTDAGQIWQTIGIGLKTPSLDIDRSHFKPGQDIRIRVIATNGLQRSVIMTDNFKI
ncbi:MAG: hypothetical protein KME60_27590 [Cyanomargarita calcarea GSE-NOS-MK-12-04C]|jgi:hypothetical protein|uniref:Uncharacterized protein n=1 Tax=Cyanomargarita calcarea GSE-NOS-MK-12-04C TaxID=2839659 RepID=A0A951UYL0_9CYAN|nr:hypothetical protein [Cyanomargarita calcarea GSE-NOS-MK-12-04C]